MLRLMLCLGILICSSVVGLHYSGRLTKRRDTLVKLSGMMNKASIRMSYSSGDLYETFSDNFAGFEFSRDKPFEIRWEAFIDSVSGALTRDDIILFKNFIGDLGVSDAESQQRCFKLLNGLLGEKIAEAERDIEAKAKVYRVLPISAGLLISILII